MVRERTFEVLGQSMVGRAMRPAARLCPTPSMVEFFSSSELKTVFLNQAVGRGPALAGSRIRMAPLQRGAGATPVTNPAAPESRRSASSDLQNAWGRPRIRSRETRNWVQQ
jgi:hypothetical protein